MDETQISITIRPIYVERLIYWIIILILAVLLIFAWMKDDSTDTTTKTTETTPTKTVTQTPPPTTPVETKPAATCTDATKNQDETDIDCGGSCGLKCAAGKSCKANSDCVSGICTANVCTNTAPQTLSGSFAVDLTDVALYKTTTKRPDNTTYERMKVTGISYKIENGLSQEINGLTVKVFIKNKQNSYCLNQLKSGTCDDAYATFSVGRLAAGKSITEEHEFVEEEYTTKAGRYIADGNGYEAGDVTRDDFNVIMYVYDQSGDLIGGKTYSDSYTVAP
jgi:hypothetical protein